jgi:hypothetical protein
LNKQELRDAVRAQLEVDDEELPDSRLDLYLADAFQRTIQQERKWPFLEMEWTLGIPEGEPETIPADLAGIDHVYMVGQDQLRFLDHGFAEENYGRDGSVGHSRFYSVRNGKVYLWPAPFEDDVELLITGWRKPTDFFTADAGAEPDCDSRLHIPLIWAACALAQLANEDEVLDQSYVQKWEQGVVAARNDIMRPDPARARILHGGIAKIRTRYGGWMPSL